MDEVVWFDPPPREVPGELASPFDPAPPHPLARRAADALIAWLRDRPRLDEQLAAPGGGKMFGVLVVRAPDGRIGWLRAFSGMLDGAWHVPGFAPPLFDLEARDSFWPAGQARLRALDDALRALDDDPANIGVRAEHAAVVARHAAEAAALAALHRAHRAARHAARAATTDPAARHALDQASRADTAEQRRQLARHAGERADLDHRVTALAAERDRLAHQRADGSRSLLKQVHDAYRIVSARGERRDLRALFAPGEPPGGAGDCAAPKLLAHAYRLGLAPIALAELWWGAPPLTGGRRAGQFYPACRGKCGPILPVMLDGLAHAPPPIFGADPIAADEPRAVFEDDWLVVVDKPCGLLSVPGRTGLLTDSVLTRLRARYPDLPELSIVHRLDLDTSGLVIVAKRATAHAALQRAFAARQIDKRYAAWLDGELARDAGTIDLPLRVDLDDRPRQIVDPVHGKPALTEWRVIARAPGRTRVALIPRTGRTHQLRVHAAHPSGLGAPIAGDRLYGRAADGERLALHAEALAFTHPHTGARIELVRPAPF